MEYLQSEHEVECYYALLSVDSTITSGMYPILLAHYRYEGFLVAEELLVYICNTLGLYPTPTNYAQVQEYRRTSYPPRDICKIVKHRFPVDDHLYHKVKAVIAKHRILNASHIQDKVAIILQYYQKRRRRLDYPRLKASDYTDVGYLVKILNNP